MDSLYLFGSSIRVSQALAIVLFVTCAAILIYLAIKKPNKPLYRMQPANADGDATLDKAIATSEAQNVDGSEELSPDSESENDDRSSKNEE